MTGYDVLGSAFEESWMVVEVEEGQGMRVLCECPYEEYAQFIASRLNACIGAGGVSSSTPVPPSESEEALQAMARCARCGLMHRYSTDTFDHPFELPREQEADSDGTLD